MVVKRRYSHVERPHQKAFVRWFKIKHPKIVIAHHANGGNRNVIEGRHFRDMGVCAGMPDLAIYCARNGFNGLIIEMKPPKPHKSTVSKEQNEIIARLEAENYDVYVAYGVHQAIDIAEGYMGLK